MSVWNLFSTFSTALFGNMVEISDRYTPSIEDILEAKQILTEKGALPLEIVDTIIDFAEYWIKTTTCRTRGQIAVRAGGESENRLLLRSYPLGYIPTKDNPTTLSPTVADEYPAVPSTPWLEPGDFPHNVTQEVIGSWTRDMKPRGEVPCRKIVFTIKSHDQGWGGPAGCRGTYKGSSTWFDVGLETLSATRHNQRQCTASSGQDRGLTRRDIDEILGGMHAHSGTTALPYFCIPDPQSTSTKPRILCTTRTIKPETYTRTVLSDDPDVAPKTLASFRHDLNPGMDCLQRNRTGTRDTSEHVITWSRTDDIMDPDSVDAIELDKQGRGRETGNGEYVRNLKLGDVVTIWAKARYQGWVNTVEEVKIDVYWAV